MFKNMNITIRVALLLFIVAIGFAALICDELLKTREVMEYERKVSVQSQTEAVLSTIEHIRENSKAQGLPESGARRAALEVVRAIRYLETEYFFIIDQRGTMVMHPYSPQLEGRSVIKKADPDGVFPFEEMVIIAGKEGAGFVEYRWNKSGSEEPVPKISYVSLDDEWGWIIGTGVYVDDIDQKFWAIVWEVVRIAGLILVVVFATGMLISKSIINGISGITASMLELAQGNTQKPIPFQDENNEIGQMAKTVEIFRQSAIEKIRIEEEQKKSEERQAGQRRQDMLHLADEFDSRVGQIVEAVNEAASNMQGMSTQLAAAIEETTRQSSAVASAAHEASTNVQTVASAAEELSASIREISSNVSDTATMTKNCSDAAMSSQEKLDQLQSAVDEIDAVIQSIVDVAEQTNLLALNATIEAARAGEAGKGFAVVASEVKNLAGQTHKMTEDISSKIARIKDSSAATISSVNDILTQIGAVDEKTTSVASAIEEQNASTTEISRNVQEASNGTSEVSQNVQGIQQAASESAGATDQLKMAAGSLSQQARDLKDAVTSFLNDIRS